MKTRIFVLALALGLPRAALAASTDPGCSGFRPPEVPCSTRGSARGNSEIFLRAFGLTDESKCYCKFGVIKSGSAAGACAGQPGTCCDKGDSAYSPGNESYCKLLEPLPPMQEQPSAPPAPAAEQKKFDCRNLLYGLSCCVNKREYSKRCSADPSTEECRQMRKNIEDTFSNYDAVDCGLADKIMQQPKAEPERKTEPPAAPEPQGPDCANLPAKAYPECAQEVKAVEGERACAKSCEAKGKIAETACNRSKVMAEDSCEDVSNYAALKSDYEKCCEETRYFSGKVVGAGNQPLAGIKVYFNCPDAKKTVVTDSAGKFYLERPGDAACTVFYSMGVYRAVADIKPNDYVVTKKVSPPADMGTVQLLTFAELQKKLTDNVRDFLLKATGDKALAVDLSKWISFEPTQDTPKFMENRVRFVSGATFAIVGNPEVYASDEEDAYHELGHAVMQKFLCPDLGANCSELASGGESHDFFEKSGPETAFDEARAHFFSVLMQKYYRTGSQDSQHRFDIDGVTSAMKDKKIDRAGGEGAEVEASVASFLLEHYKNVPPEAAMRDYMDTLSACRKVRPDGKSCQNIQDFMDAKTLTAEDVRNAKLLGIPVKAAAPEAATPKPEAAEPGEGGMNDLEDLGQQLHDKINQRP